MGLLDLPAPLFYWIDGASSGAVPATLRLWIWGVVGGVASMGLYWLLSPQKRISATKRELAEAQQALNSFDGEFSEAAPMMRRMLGLAFKQVGIVVIPAVIAMAPVLCLLAWMSTAYGYSWPAPGATVETRTHPEQGYSAQWASMPGSDNAAHVLITDESGSTLEDHAMDKAVPVLHKRAWWNALIGNPAGYLPEDLAVDAVEIELPEKHYLGFGPGWLRGWEFSFILAVTIGALGLKLGFRIE